MPTLEVLGNAKSFAPSLLKSMHGLCIDNIDGLHGGLEMKEMANFDEWFNFLQRSWNAANNCWRKNCRLLNMPASD